jgi:hypothetical protein
LGFVSGLAMFLMQGFHTLEFHLEKEEMRWIGGATVGSLGGLITTVVGALFRKQR